MYIINSWWTCKGTRASTTSQAFMQQCYLCFSCEHWHLKSELCANTLGARLLLFLSIVQSTQPKRNAQHLRHARVAAEPIFVSVNDWGVAAGVGLAQTRAASLSQVWERKALFFFFSPLFFLTHNYVSQRQRGCFIASYHCIVSQSGSVIRALEVLESIFVLSEMINLLSKSVNLNISCGFTDTD